MSLDLHGYTVAEAIELFVKHYNSRVERGDLSRFTVVHGYGSGGTGGKIRTALRRLLAAFEDELQMDTDPVNPGITSIIPGKKLPSGAGILTGEIIEYCAGGKSESKILGRFRNHGDLNVKRTLQKLVKQGSLSLIVRGRHRIYRS